jgi:quercetin dioxygenase-like cupin family protein
MGCSSAPTKWGHLSSIFADGYDEAVVELARFDSESRNHEHDNWELAICLHGSGGVFLAPDTMHHDIQAGMMVVIPPKTEHRMVPDAPGFLFALVYHDDFEWVPGGP